MAGNIGADPLFMGLTRPPMIAGVSYTFAALNGIITLLAFVITNNFIYLFVILPGVHGFGWFLCLKEPRAIELFIVRYSKCNLCRNRSTYGGINSYDVY